MLESTVHNFEGRLAEKDAIITETEREATINQLLLGKSVIVEAEKDAIIKQLSSRFAAPELRCTRTSVHRASKRSRRKIVAARSLLSLYCCAPSNVTVAESFHINIESVELSTRLEQVESKLESGKVCSKVTSAASPSQTFLQGRMEGHTSAFFVFDKIQTLFRQWHCHCPHSRLQRFESDRRMQCRHV